MGVNSGVVRDALLGALASQGGVIERSNGTCTSRLVELTGLAASQVSGGLTNLGKAGRVDRVTKGKRTYRVALANGHVALADSQLSATPEPDSSAQNGSGAPQTEGPGDYDPERPGESEVDYNAVALALLSRVMKIVSAPDEVKVRLAETLEECHRLREQKRDLLREKDQAEANYRRVAKERDGLRLRVRTLEDNMAAAVKGGTRIIDEQVRQRIDTFMRERPQGSKVPV